MRFIHDGTFWKWTDKLSHVYSPVSTSLTSDKTKVSTSLPSPSMLAVSHTGAVYEF